MPYIPKFKLFDKVTGKIYPVDVIEYPLSGRGIIITTYINDMNKFVFNIYKDDEECPYVLLQSVGMKDKTGRDMYVGDIIFVEEIGELYIKSLNYWYSFVEDYDFFPEQALIVGNVYEE